MNVSIEQLIHDNGFRRLHLIYRTGYDREEREEDVGKRVCMWVYENNKGLRLKLLESN